LGIPTIYDQPMPRRTLRIKTRLGRLVILWLASISFGAVPQEQQVGSQLPAAKSKSATTNRRIPPPKFSRAYVEPVQGVLDLEPINVAALVQWNRTLLVIVRTPGAQPATIHPTRSFAMMHAAIYDAVNSIQRC